MLYYIIRIAPALSLIFAFSCAPYPHEKLDYSREPIGMQLVRADPWLKGKRFNTLMDFESVNDLVFVTSTPAAQAQINRIHTGSAAAAIGMSAKINLSSLMIGREFPGNWTLVGGYLWSPRPAHVVMQCMMGNALVQRSMDLPAETWTPVFVDLTRLTDGARAEAWLTINADQPLLCDDIMVVDNAQWLVGGPDVEAPWTIRRRGFKIIGERTGMFGFTLDSSEGSSNGWRIDEISTMRARFSSDGKTKALTVYADGRSYWDGRITPLSLQTKSESLYADEHDSPAELSVAEGMGRVNRSTAGDSNNDGYNECRGAYELAASSPRMEVLVIPRGSSLLRPMLEISGLPPGKAIVTMESRLIESWIRLPDGNLLIDLSARIDRPATVEVRIDETVQ